MKSQSNPHKPPPQNTLAYYIWQYSIEQATRFQKLEPEKQAVAAEGIIAKLRLNKIKPFNDITDAIREIIDDAQKGKAVFKQINDDEADLEPLKNGK